MPSSTVMTPSLPTFSKASAISLPMAGSLLAQIAATCSISSFLVSCLASLSSRCFDGRLDGLVDAALDGHRVGAGGDVAQAFLIDRQGQDGRRGGAVAGHVAGLLGDGVDELGAHVLERIGQVDFLGDGDAVLGDGRAAEGLVDDDVAAGRPERDADGLGQLLGAREELLAGVVGVEQLLRHIVLVSRVSSPQSLSRSVTHCDLATAGLADCRTDYFTTFARMSLSRRILSSLPPSTLMSLPA